MVKNGWKWPKKPKLAKWLKEAENGQKWPKLAKMAFLLLEFSFPSIRSSVRPFAPICYICVGHTAWAPEGREAQIPARSRGPEGP